MTAGPDEPWDLDRALAESGVPDPKAAREPPARRASASGTPAQPSRPAQASNPGRLVSGGDPDAARERAWAEQALFRELDELADATPGHRNDALNRAAFNLGQVVAGGALSEAQVAASLFDAAMSLGLGETEASKTIDSGMSKGALSPRRIPPRPQPQGTTDQGSAAGSAGGAAGSDASAGRLAELTDDPEFWACREWLAYIRGYATSRRTAPWAVLGVVLARVVAQTPPFVVLPALAGSEASLNQFIALVGPSGAGKGAAIGVGTEIMPSAIDSIGAGSGEGVGHLFVSRSRQGQERIRESVILTVEEIDTLTALNERRGSTLLPELRKAWSGEALGFGYADHSKALVVASHSYRLSLIAGVQPGRAAGLFGEEDAGTPQRFIWLPATDLHAPDQPPETPEFRAWRRVRDMPVADFRTRHVAMDVCTAARATVDANRLAGLRGSQEALDGHALLARLKVAASLALLDGRLAVSDEDWELSGTVMAVSDAVRGSIQRELGRQAVKRAEAAGRAEAAKADAAASATEQRAVARLFDRIPRLLANGPMTGATLRSAVAYRDRDYLDDAIADLVRLQKIKAIDIPGSGTSGVSYELS